MIFRIAVMAISRVYLGSSVTQAPYYSGAVYDTAPNDARDADRIAITAIS